MTPHPSPRSGMRRLLLSSRLLPLLAFAAAGAGCGGGESGGGSALQYYQSADPLTQDPALSAEVQSGEVVTTLFDNLVQFDVDAQLVPGLATRWEADSTGGVYTFQLPNDATF